MRRKELKKKEKKKKDFWSRGSNYAKRPKALFAASIAPFKFTLRLIRERLEKASFTQEIFSLRKLNIPQQISSFKDTLLKK